MHQKKPSGKKTIGYGQVGEIKIEIQVDASGQNFSWRALLPDGSVFNDPNIYEDETACIMASLERYAPEAQAVDATLTDEDKAALSVTVRVNPLDRPIETLIDVIEWRDTLAGTLPAAEDEIARAEKFFDEMIGIVVSLKGPMSTQAAKLQSLKDTFNHLAKSMISNVLQDIEALEFFIMHKITGGDQQ